MFLFYKSQIAMYKLTDEKRSYVRMHVGKENNFLLFRGLLCIIIMHWNDKSMKCSSQSELKHRLSYLHTGEPAPL